ncbi:MAG: hypothetical protein ACF8PN_00545 [Phycisphaerales bacterium]
MNSEREHPVDSSLEAYLDDTLSESERTAFEARLEAEPALRAELAKQERLNARLTAIFEPPAGGADRIVRSVATPSRESAGSWPHSAPARRLLAVAACLAVLLFAGWSIRRSLTPDAYEPRPFQTFAEIYANPDAEWECEPGPDFYRQYYARYKTGLLIPEELPDGIDTAGFGYANSLSEDTLYILATVDGERVLVLTDRVEVAGGPATELPADSTLNVFRDEINGLVMYELTPFDEPRLLDLFYIPESVPPSWTPGG